jgi:hypothetical protein
MLVLAFLSVLASYAFFASLQISKINPFILPSYLAFYLLLVCPKRAKLPSYLCLLISISKHKATKGYT